MAAPRPCEAPTPTTSTLPFGASAMTSGRWRGAGALVEQQLHPAFALFRRQLRAVFGRASGHRHAALHSRARAHRLEPALEVFELIDVLPLRLPTGGPGVTDHVGDRVLVAGDPGAVVEAVVEHAVHAVHLV